LTAQQHPDRSPGPGVNNPAAPTSPAGSVRTGKRTRGRGAEAPQGRTPHLPDGTVDFSGVWQGCGPVGDLRGRGWQRANHSALGGGQAVMDARQSKDDPEANCLPTGSRGRALSLASRADADAQKSPHIYFLFEGNIHSYRQVFMDGRKHPADPDPTVWSSIGWYEGDTSSSHRGFNDKFWFDFAGTRTPSSCTRSSAGRARTWAR